MGVGTTGSVRFFSLEDNFKVWGGRSLDISVIVYHSDTVNAP